MVQPLTTHRSDWQSPVEFLVIIPTFRRLEQLKAAIQSALSQTGVTKQVVVADDCPDGSAEATVRSFPEVRYLKNPRPTGGWPGRVRNFAFNHMMEEGMLANLVHFLDDDDTVPPGYYQAVRHAFNKHTQCGVVFGVMRPFCQDLNDPDLDQRKQLQLQQVRTWRQKATRYPWLYQHLGGGLFTRWLFYVHAIFGPEMFLCSGGVIRQRHVAALGGFPDARITQDFSFFTEAIRKYGVLFLPQESAGYGVGNSIAVWNILDLKGADKDAHTREWIGELATRKKLLLQELGTARYLLLRVAYKGQMGAINTAVLPFLDWRGKFKGLDAIITGSQCEDGRHMKPVDSVLEPQP